MADPAPPKDLDATGKHLYRKLRDYLKAQSTWEASDHYLVERACLIHQRRREAWDQLPREDGRRQFTTQGRSENSGEVAHPLVKIVESADKEFIACLREMGLTPAARKRLEIEVRRGGGGKFGLD